MLADVLSWQLPRGCYGKMKRPKFRLQSNGIWDKLKGSFDDDYVDEDTQQELDVGNGQNVFEMNRNQGRKLLAEKVMSGKETRSVKKRFLSCCFPAF